MPLGVEDGFRCEQAQGGEFGAGEENASSDERKRNLAFRRVGTIEEAREAKPLDGAEDGSDVTMREGGNDFELLGQRCGGSRRRFTFEGGLEGIDGVSGAFGKIGEGALPNFAIIAERLAQENGWRRVSVRDGFDIHGYLQLIKIDKMQHIIRK